MPAETDEQQIQQMWKEELARDKAGEQNDPPQQDQPAATAATGQPASQQSQPGTEQPAQQQSQEDPTLNEPVVLTRAQYDRLMAVVDSTEKLAGRVRNTEAHIGGLTSSLKAVQQKTVDEIARITATVSRAQTAAPTQAQINAAVNNDGALAGPKWQKLMQEFPDWAEAVEERFGSQARTNAAPAPTAPPAAAPAPAAQPAQGGDAIDGDAEFWAVSQKRPGWAATVRTQEFKDWLSSQPPAIRTLGDSERATDVLQLLDSYAHFQASAIPKTADQVNASRKERLTRSVTPHTNVPAPPAKSEADKSMDEIWKEERARVYGR